MIRGDGHMLFQHEAAGTDTGSLLDESGSLQVDMTVSTEDSQATLLKVTGGQNGSSLESYSKQKQNLLAWKRILVRFLSC